LLSFAAKKNDPRYWWYVDHYGVDTWKLDANRVRAEIEQYIDLET